VNKLNTPVVTMKVEPRDLQLIDAALDFLSRMAVLTIQTLTNPATACDPLPSDIIINYVDEVGLTAADGDLKRLVRRSDLLRRDMGLSRKS